MGHWEQIGQENRAERARRERLPPWRRIRWFDILVVYPVGLLFTAGLIAVLVLIVKRAVTF